MVRLARRGRLNRQTGRRSDPQDGPGNQVRRSQGRRARNPAAPWDCGLVRSLRTVERRSPPVPSGAFVCAGPSSARLRHVPSARPTTRPTQDWRVLVAVFWITSMVEGLGVSQIFALLPTYLRQMGVTESDRLAFIGLFSALIFVVGMPLVPLWGVWADKYSRKAVIVRSALVEAVVFAGVALAREPWQLAASMLLIGLQLGNTGVMLAGIRDVTPRARLGTTISIFGASGPIGFAVGPALAGLLIDGAGWSVSGVFWLSAVLSIGTAVLVGFGSSEIRPTVVPEGRVLDLAYGAIKAVISDP